MNELKEVITMLEVLKEQSLKSCKDTAVLDVNVDSFNFAIDKAIELLKRESDTLNKIRDEIEEHAKINQNLNTDRTRALCWCLDIIDKYKTENCMAFGGFDENVADIKLAITIPEPIYKASQITNVKYKDVIQIPLEVIKNGTPLPNSCKDCRYNDGEPHAECVVCNKIRKE